MEDSYERDESEAERLDRNYGELLQELRVAQTGVQVLFAFLLGIAFTQRYSALVEYQKIFYVVTLIAAACTAILLIAPVAVHRMLFREHLKDEVVEFTSRLAASGLAFLALSILSSVLFVLDVVLSLAASIIVTAILGALIILIWLVLPARQRRNANV
jgi:tellurite resistance protein TehA-like permease